MRLKKIFILLILSFLSASCSDNIPAYRQIWQESHHLDDSAMVKMYGEPREDVNNIFGAVLEAVDGNWDKVASLTEGSRTSEL